MNNYANKSDNLEEMDNFLETHSPPKPMQQVDRTKAGGRRGRLGINTNKEVKDQYAKN